MALLGAAGVTTEAIVTRGRMTTSKTRVMGGSHHLMRIDREDSSPISEALEDESLARLKSVLLCARALAISDYGKGMLTDRVLIGAIAMARAAGVPVISGPETSELFRSMLGRTSSSPTAWSFRLRAASTAIPTMRSLTPPARLFAKPAQICWSRERKRACPISRRAHSRFTCPRMRSSYSMSRAPETRSWRRSPTGWSVDCRSSSPCGSPI